MLPLYLEVLGVGRALEIRVGGNGKGAMAGHGTALFTEPVRAPGVEQWTRRLGVCDTINLAATLGCQVARAAQAPALVAYRTVDVVAVCGEMEGCAFTALSRAQARVARLEEPSCK